MEPPARPEANRAEGWHSVLRRQLLRAGLADQQPPSDPLSWQGFLSRVSLAYTEADEQQYLHDRAVEVSSREMAGLYEELQGLYSQLNETYDELRRASASSLALERDRLQTVFDAVPSGLIVLGSRAEVLDVNPSAEAMLGLAEHSWNGNPLEDLVVEDQAGVIESLRQACLAGAVWHVADAEVTATRRGSFPVALHFIPLKSGNSPAGGVLSLLDLSDRKRAEEELAWRATHDVLTRALNRAAFIERVSLGLARGDRDERPRAVMFLDLDRFKLVNDTLGHAAGDRLLVMVTARISAAIREVDALARIGGDEFVILLDGISDPTDIDIISQRLTSSLGLPFDLGYPVEDEVFISASIGVSVSDVGATPNSLLEDADVALYAAKRRGRDRCVIFDHSMRDEVAARMKLERMLRTALDADDLYLAFQPVFALGSGALLGFEGLLRWTDRDGPVAPSDFVPLAEETGLIHRMGASALEMGAAFAAELAARPGGDALTVSVNVSGMQVTHGDLATQVGELLSRHGLPGARLVLELNETALLSDPSAAAARMRAVADLGVGVALDDFGTGFSSLTSLREFPLAALKVDRVFTRNVDSSARDRAIVQAVVALGHALGLTVIAEGVESVRHMEILEEMGCDAGQGYFLGRPLVKESALALAAAWCSQGR